MSERWLLVFNCQTVGLTNCLTFLSPNVEVKGVDIWDYTHNHAVHNAGMGEFARVVMHPELQGVTGYDVALAKQVSFLPGVYFEGYHPDTCFAETPGGVLKGPLQDYMSLIALAAYEAGLSYAETLRLYNGKTYEKCGYMDVWDGSRDQLIQTFQQYGLDVRPVFSRWGLRRPFMYSTNHPRIEVLQDIARLFMLQQGVRVQETDVLPADNLANGPCFPVYPEIGEALGVEGSYLFKPIGKYTYLTLAQYVRSNFDLFEQHPRGSFKVGSYQPRLERVQAVIRGEA